jgi:hypothetical protein
MPKHDRRSAREPQVAAPSLAESEKHSVASSAAVFETAAQLPHINVAGNSLSSLNSSSSTPLSPLQERADSGMCHDIRSSDAENSSPSFPQSESSSASHWETIRSAALHIPAIINGSPVQQSKDHNEEMYFTTVPCTFFCS